jgi:Oxysterol-binding protein
LSHEKLNRYSAVRDQESEELISKFHTGRRTKLPAPRPDLEGLSLWNLLCKNIGKDLSKVSMPVALNEPLNMLQVSAEVHKIPVGITF